MDGGGVLRAEAMVEESAKSGSGSPCPVVGIGGSSGALRALSEIFEHLPSDTGMAFVCAFHPEGHARVRPAALAKIASMPVVPGADGVRLEPDRVYTLSPGSDAVISNGSLTLGDRSDTPPQYPLDRFFRSLARDQEHRAVAVLVSGECSDGVLGLAAVKGHGGITLVRADPERRTNGTADLSPPGDAIGEILARLARHPYLGQDPDALQAEINQRLARMLEVVRLETNANFGGWAGLERRIARHMAVLNVSTPEDYLQRLATEPGAVRALEQDLKFRTGIFFFDPALLTSLAGNLLPELLGSRPPDDRFRLWVPQCAAGEAAYSLAICVLETLSELRLRVPVQVFGTDISGRLVADARTGTYPESISQDLSPERVRRFFRQQQDGSLRVSPQVRDLCIFARHNLLRDPPFSNLDLIDGRGLLEQISADLRPMLISLLHHALKPSGLLLFNTGEAPPEFAKLFAAINGQPGVYRKNPSSGSPREQKSNPLTDIVNAWQQVDRFLVTPSRQSAALVDERGQLLELAGDAKKFLKRGALRSASEAGRAVVEQLRGPLNTVLQKARETGQPMRIGPVEVAGGEEGEAAAVLLQVLPFRLGDRVDRYLVLFNTLIRPGDRGPSPPGAPLSRAARLEGDLASATEYFQSVVEDLRSANEEALSKNEELQSLNDEIEASRAELQASNEELQTVNAELRDRYAELGRVIADLNGLLASLDLPMVMVDPEMRIRHYTPHSSEVFRLIPGDLGRPLSDLQSNLQLDDVAGFVQEALRSGESREREVRDNDERWYLMRARAYRLADGNVGGAVLTLIDITARKRVEEERERLLDRVENERAQFEMLIQRMPAGVVLAAAPAGRVVMTNPLVEKILGGTWEAVQEHSAGKAFHPDGTPYGRDDWPLMRSLQRGEVVSDEELDYVRADGSRFTLRASSVPIRDTRGTIVAAVLVFDEITEQKILREKLAQSQKLETIGRLAGGVAHDFNNLLTVISGYSQMVFDDLPSDSPLRSELDTVLQAAGRATTLTGQLLAFSRRQIMQPQTFDLNQIVTSMEKMLRRVIGENIEMATDLASEPCMVHADPGQVEQVVMNLATNARDAVARGGRIKLETANVVLDKTPERNTAAYVRLAVTDNGTGMDEETRRHVFEPFFTTKEVGRGTGLGLSSVYGIVKQNGGEITVTSKPGEGTRFEVLLPRAAPAAERHDRASAPAQARGRETILIVEDETAVRELLRKHLERLGYSVIVAPNGVQALQRLEGRSVDLVLTDVVMPQMDGWELVRRLRARCPSIKVIFTSGYPPDTLDGRALMGSHDTFLEKPFTPEALSRKIRKVLDAGVRRNSSGG